MRKAPSSTRPGFSVVEVLLAASIFALLVTALVGAFLYGQESSALAGARARAGQLADEGLEASRSIRDGAFTNLVDGSHGLAISGNVWTYSGTQDVTGQFTRSVTVSTVDASTKELTSTVTWQQNAQRTGSASATTRLTNWAAAVAASWANPNTLAGSLNIAGNQDGLKVEVQGNFAYAVRNSGTPNFAVINIANPATPTLVGSLPLSGGPTNIAVSGNYAYVSNSSNTQEMQVIDVTNPATPTQIGSFNAPGNGDGSGVTVSGTAAYLTRVTGSGNEFFTINVANPAAPVALGSVVLGQTANEVHVQGTYAYVVGAGTAAELRVINVSNPATPAVVGSLNLAGTSNALTVDGVSSTIVLGRANGELDTVDIAAPMTPTLLGSLILSGSANDVNLNATGTLAFVATNAATAELQVVNIGVPATPSLTGTYDASGALNGVTYSTSQDRAYAASAANAQEFIAVQP